jgi:formylmethanofuran dehydrogenase subunit E
MSYRMSCAMSPDRPAFLGSLLFIVTMTFAALAQAASPVDDSPEATISLGERIHGSFGTYVALGVRLGRDAVTRLSAHPGTLEVTVFQGPASPCPCIADGLMIATGATPGRGTLRVAMQSASADQFAVVIVRDRETERILRYEIPDALRARLDEWNRIPDAAGRYRVVMEAAADALFEWSFVEATANGAGQVH